MCNLKTLSVSVCIAMILSGCGGGSSSSQSPTSNNTSSTTKIVTFTAVDGLLSGVKGVIVINGEKYETITDANGIGVFTNIPNDFEGNVVVVATENGIDTATGEKYEGVMEGPIAKDEDEVVVSPVTTMLSGYLKKSGSFTKESIQAQAQVLASQIGVNKDAIRTNPLKTLESLSSTQEEKDDAAILLKTALNLQKTSEAISKAFVNSSDTVYNANEEENLIIASELSNVLWEKREFSVKNTLEDTELIVKEVASSIEQLNSYSNSKVTQKLNSATNSIKALTKIINDINTTQISTSKNISDEIIATSKAVESASLLVEDKLKGIANALDNFDTKANESENAVKALTINGSLHSLKENYKNDKNSKVSQYINDIFTPDVISEKAKEYDNLTGDLNLTNYSPDLEIKPVDSFDVIDENELYKNSDFTPPTGKVDVDGETPANKRIILATSTDGITYTKNSTQFSDQANVADFVQDSKGRLFLYYTGWTVGTKTNTTAVAISLDNGKTWVYKYINIADTTFQSPGDPDVVILEDGTFRMYYTGTKTEEERTAKILYAEGTDGINFTYKGVAYTHPSDGLAKDSLTFKLPDGSWGMYIYLTDYVYATSSDGKTFTKKSDFSLKHDSVNYILDNEYLNTDGSYTFFGFSLINKNIASFKTTDGETFTYDRVIVSYDGTHPLESSYLKNGAPFKLQNNTYILAYTTVIE